MHIPFSFFQLYHKSIQAATFQISVWRLDAVGQGLAPALHQKSQFVNTDVSTGIIHPQRKKACQKARF
jgi:hypothetical protein